MSHPTRQRGITLIEIILWSAIVAAAAVALFVFAGRARVAAAVETEQRQVEQLVRTVDGLFQLQPNFAALGTNGAAYLDLRGAERSGLKFTRTEHGVLTLATGVGKGELNLAVWDVEQPSGPAIRSGGYRLVYQGLSTAECVGLASALGKSAHQVRVGMSGLDDGSADLVAHRYGRPGGPDQLAELCSRDGRVVFVYFAPARAIASSVPGAGAVAPRCRPQRETTYAVCPPGQMGAITQVRDSWGCGEYRLVSGAWVPTPGSVTIDDSLNGGWFGNGLQGTRCVYGYTDVLDANGYPTPLSTADRAKIVYDYTTPAPDDLDVFYQNSSNGHWVGEVGFGQVYARNSPPADVRGERCSWTKFEFMNN